MEIAIYGKGGIGKSTVSANLSTALAKEGLKILQIGCDPKHDSTRLLLHGEKIQTVLDYIREVGVKDYHLEDLVHPGIYGIACVEAGGPKPGVGCAGRGILSTFEVLENLGLDRDSFDLVLYDVLGDVVCGGFAVPLREDYADKVYIVTSGEFMSIYAANNILRGLANYKERGNRVGGLIFNERGFEGERERVETFGRAVGLPILGYVARDGIFAACEERGQCIVEGAPESLPAQEMVKIAKKILAQEDLYPAKPLEDDILEALVLGHKIGQKGPKVQGKFQLKKRKKKEESYYSKSLMEREPLHGCAYNGAMNLAIQIRDGITISHGPRSCANLSYQAISSLGRRSLLEKSIVLPAQIHPRILSSEMGEDSMVFGGIEDLNKALDQALKERPKLITVVTTCPSGIIGDHVQASLPKDSGDSSLIYLETDGNLSGDYMQGMILAYKEIAKQLVENEKTRDPFLVNVYGEKPIANSTQGNISRLEGWLKPFGGKIHCRYLLNTTRDRVRTMMKAGLHISAFHDYMDEILQDFFKKTYGITFFPHALPLGYDETVTFLRGLGDFYKKPDLAQEMIEEGSRRYQREMEGLREDLQGKKLMLVTYNNRLDWILKTALDLGMEVVKVGLMNFSQDIYRESIYRDRIGEWEVDYSADKRRADVHRLKPDLVVANYNGPNMDQAPFHDTIQLTPDIGFDTGISLAKRWKTIFKQGLKEGWREDEKLFNTYQA